MKHESIAVLIRGLIINLTGNPQTVISQGCEGEILIGSMVVELNGDENEEVAAGIIKKTFDNWKNTHPFSDQNLPIPSCVTLKINNRIKVLFWIGNDIDTAQKKLANKDTSPFFEIKSVRGNVVNAKGRADVVRNKIALVTGGAQGIGEEIVRNLAAAGAIVFIADLNIKGAEKLNIGHNLFS